jgi:hypothetical protein
MPPGPFTPGLGYVATPTGGVPPYTFTAIPSPPNPPGVRIEPNGMSADIDCPPGTPPGTRIQVNVTDSSQPPQSADASHTTR